MGHTGFLSNTAVVAAIGTSYALAKKATLTYNDGTATVDTASSRPPGDLAEFGRLLLHFSAASGVTDVECYFSWDAAGDLPASGLLSSSSPIAGLTTATKISFGIGLDRWTPVAPAGYSTSTLYLHVKRTGGTSPQLDSAYLLWRQLPEMF